MKYRQILIIVLCIFSIFACKSKNTQINENIYDFKEFASWQGITADNLDISQYNLSLQNTISIFLLQNEKGYFFCIPIQYMGDYQISSFDFTSGNISFTDYNLTLNNENTDISIYLNTTQDEIGSFTENFHLIYSKEKEKIFLSNLNVPLPLIDNSNDKQNHYYIFIERYLTRNELLNILSLYEKGNITAQYSIWYDITIDNNEQKNSGILDNFRLFNGQSLDPSFYPPNLNFFKAKYLQ